MIRSIMIPVRFLKACLCVMMLTLTATVLAQTTPPPTSSFRIMLPQPFAKTFPNEVPHRLALYDGATSTGATTSGPIAYFQPSLDDRCEIDVRLVMSRSVPSFAMIDKVQSEECALSDYVIQLQRLDVQVVLLADNVCQCSPGTTNPPVDFIAMCTELANLNRKRLGENRLCDTKFERILEDDLAFSSVRIPVVQIDWVAAEKIKHCLKGIGDPNCVERSTIIGSFRWGKRTPQVYIELWSSSETEWPFKQSFAPYAKKLQRYIHFQPRFFIYKGNEWGCNPQGADPFCNVACIDNAYCAQGSMVVNGKSVVEETLRQLCIYQQASEQSMAATQWWDYVARFVQDCQLRNFTKQCSDAVQTSIVGLSPKNTDSCMAKSWTSPSSNTLLENEITSRVEQAISRLPSLVVSGMVIRGDLAMPSIRSLLTLICDRLEQPSPLCKCLSVSPVLIIDCLSSTCEKDEVFCMQTKKCYSKAEEEQFLVDCTVCPPQLKYCLALRRCSDHCPACPEAIAPYYCTLSGSCVKDEAQCVAVDDEDGASGVHHSEVIALSMFLVMLLGSVGLAWWRRQRSKFRSSVSEMMERYIPLDEQRRRGVARPTRVEPEANTDEQSAVAVT